MKTIASNGGKHIYTYDASGWKLRAEHHVPVVVAAEPQIPIEDLIPPNDNPEIPDDSEQMPYEPPQEWGFEHMPNEWEMPWQQFEEQVAPFVCIMPPMPPDDEIIIDQPMPDDQLIEDEVPCDVTSTDYCGNFIYENGTLKRILVPGGYVTFLGDDIDQPEYHFYFTDHQGNVRVAVGLRRVEFAELANHYYPYGGLMGESLRSDLLPYKYNGKELDRHSGLDWYDYGARWYNGISWMTPDPLAEKYYDTSPYVYCLGNPIKYIDPDGKRPTGNEAALMAKHVYKDKHANDIEKELNMAGWYVSKINTSIREDLNHTGLFDCGLQTEIYERTINGKTEYAYAFAGTNSLKDFCEDLIQLTSPSLQYSHAINNAVALSDELGDKFELTFIGHSLGGGEAAASMATGRDAITFNRASVSNATKSLNNLSGSTSNVTDYRIVGTTTLFNGKVTIGGDPVSNIQDNLGIGTKGKTIPVPVKGLFKHSIDEFLKHNLPNAP